MIPGEDLLEQIRLDAQFASIPVVVMTDAPVPHELMRAANAVLAKPFDWDDLRKTIDQLISSGRSPDSRGGA